MADTRINALSTATSSVSDDFVPIDGTTNGTRKLSAFSPSFGGNATVAGTLTVNGVATAGSYLTSAAGLAFPGALSASGYYLYSGSANGLTMYGYGSTYDVYIGNRAGTRALSVAANSTVVSIPDTTISTSTSSGALVVSGGVGVAGAITAGGTLRVVGSSQIIRVRHDASNIEFTNTAQDAYVTGTVIGNTLQLHGNNGTGLTIGSTGNATFAGNITTGAPSGGTAAAWKLGAVASVSPTSPNRTIEVDIGGTIYYIHAKTTNN